MAYVPVPKDLNAVKTKVLLNLTKRQLVCFSAGAALGVPLFFLLKAHTGVSTAAICMILLMLPFFLLAMYEKNGQPLEKIVRNIVQVCFLRPKQRPYATNNFYAVLERQDNLDREVYRIVHPHKTHPRRTQADRGRHRKSEAAGQETEVRTGQHPVSADVPRRHLPRDGQLLHENRPVSGHQLSAQPERGQDRHL